MSDNLGQTLPNKTVPSVSRKLRAVLADAFAFVRSVESNRALQTVTLDQLINDQIRRNGDTSRSNAAQYNPYSHDPEKVEAASAEPPKRGNFLGGADTERPTKLDRILALKEEIGATVEEVKKTAVLTLTAEELADGGEYYDDEEL